MIERIRSREDFEEVAIIDDGIAAWDSALIILLRRIQRVANDRSIRLNLDALPSGVRRLMELANAIPVRAETNPLHEKGSLREQLGYGILYAYYELKAALYFLGELTYATGALIRGRARFRTSDLMTVIQECGPGALPIISLVSILVGMILAFLGSVQLKMFGAEVFIADAVAIGMVREMGALMTGVIMAGRTGAAFAAQLGTMQVNEEIDALKTMGFSPMEFLVLPRMIALILMMPLLTVYANLLGVIGGAAVGIFMLDLTPTQYCIQTMNAVTNQAVISGLIKSSVYGVLVAFSGCLQGIRCGRSAAAVGLATTRAVVNAIVYIVVADSIISIIYTFTGF